MPVLRVREHSNTIDSCEITYCASCSNNGYRDTSGDSMKIKYSTDGSNSSNTSNWTDNSDSNNNNFTNDTSYKTI